MRRKQDIPHFRRCPNGRARFAIFIYAKTARIFHTKVGLPSIRSEKGAAAECDFRSLLRNCASKKLWSIADSGNSSQLFAGKIFLKRLISWCDTNHNHFGRYPLVWISAFSFHQKELLLWTQNNVVNSDKLTSLNMFFANAKLPPQCGNSRFFVGSWYTKNKKSMSRWIISRLYLFC